MQVVHWDMKKDGVLTEESFTKKLEILGYAVTSYAYPPGTVFPEHSHGVEKVDGVLSGKFKLTLQGEEVILETGDYVVVPKGVMHTAGVVGEETVVSLDGMKESTG